MSTKRDKLKINWQHSLYWTYHTDAEFWTVGKAGHVWGEDIYGILVLSAQFFCEIQTALKNEH